MAIASRGDAEEEAAKRCDEGDFVVPQLGDFRVNEKALVRKPKKTLKKKRNI